MMPGSPKKKQKKRPQEGKSHTDTTKPVDFKPLALRQSVDEVFKPREDLDSLDEVDRDVEQFKRYLQSVHYFLFFRRGGVNSNVEPSTDFSYVFFFN